MIITIRGTSGSGKTTLARRVMDLYSDRRPVHVPNRRQPLYYVLPRLPGHAGPSLRVVGHYESPTGGADNVSGLDYVYQIVREGHEAGEDVMFEGLVVSSDYQRFRAMWQEGLPVLMVSLELRDGEKSIPGHPGLQACYDSINARRQARDGDAAKLSYYHMKDATRLKWMGVRSIMRRLEAEGAPAEWHDRDSAFERIRSALGHGGVA